MFAIDIQQTIKKAYQEIREGSDPWVALGDFSHDWYGNYPEAAQRMALVAEPLEVPGEAEPTELRQWAAFCAASVEYLCQEQLHLPLWAGTNLLILFRKRKHFIPHPWPISNACVND